MLALEFVVVLGAVILACSVLARRLAVAPPVVLLTAGVALGFVPAMQRVHLPSEAILLLFLPALLYWESLTTSLQELRRNLRGVLLTSTVLVVATASAVAAVGHAVGLSWPVAWVLGAALAPTDATAVGALAGSLPRRNVTVLRAESLVNDGTALVVYGAAVAIAAGEQRWNPVHVSGTVVLSYGGGVLAGLLAAWVAIRVRRALRDPVHDNVATLLTPFAAFLLAESVGASGVVAVVLSGLILTQAAPRFVGAAARHQTRVFWSLATFLLTAALFVLVGLELPAAVRGLGGAEVTRGLIAVAAVVVVLLVVRFVFLVASAYSIRLLDRRPQQRGRRMSNRARVVSTVAGFRGAVSLAVALSVPETITGGAPFPDRDLIVFVTAGVIAVTLVAQGLALPRVVRWADLPGDTSREEQRFAQAEATREALAALPELAERLSTPPEVLDRLHREYDHHQQAIDVDPDGDDPAAEHERHYSALRVALLDRKRATIVRLRDQRRIDDSVLLAVQDQLDTEELRLRRSADDGASD